MRFDLADADGVDAAHKVFGTKGRAQKDRGDDNAGAVGQDDLERRQRIDDDDKQRDAGDVTEDLDIQVAKDAQRLERDTRITVTATASTMAMANDSSVMPQVASSASI